MQQQQPKVNQNPPDFESRLQHAEWHPKDIFAQARVSEIFEKPSPLHADFGCGDGGFLLEMARRHPEINYLGTERLLGRVQSVTRKIARNQLDNARILRLETHYTVQHLLPDVCLQRAYVLFPDPWPKRAHHPRRLFQEAFMRDLRRVIMVGGELCIKTDDLPYFQWIEKVIAKAEGFERHTWEEEPCEAKTDFERLFMARGLPIHRTRLIRVT